MANTLETYKPLQFDAIRVGLCSPEKILEASHGEVKKPETINHRTLKPERDGLFCERIFGPTKDWECHCGKYKKIRYKGVICDKCGVEVTRAAVRRSRIGHITLESPCSHIWYFKGIPSRMGLVLDISQKNLEKVIYYVSYIVLDPGTTKLNYKDILSEREYRQAKEEYGEDTFRVGMGAEAVREALSRVDLKAESENLRAELETASGQKKAKLIKRIEVIDAFISSGNKPEWMVFTVLPVIPPDLRPMVQLDGGRFATSDLNDLYRRIINRNNRLKKLIETGAPEIILKNEKRMLQEAVDSLIDNGRRGKPVTGAGGRALKSLSEILKGKTGRFRQNLLGKRVDFSGRSVIVVGPELKIYQCGLPKEMAIELFKPFVMNRLLRTRKDGTAYAANIITAKRMVEHQDDVVWDVLDEVIKEHPVMLNRAPTLHRLGIQAFEPILVEGKAIKLHPLVCTAFNADFDGDQMAVHVPLSEEARAECRFLMLSTNNLLKPSDGGVVAVPSQDMVLGIYYLTQERPEGVEQKKAFASMAEAILAYENGFISLHSPIKVKMADEEYGIVETTVGRLLFNEIIPQDLGFIDRTNPKNKYIPEINTFVKKQDLKEILERIMVTHGPTKIATVLDDIKRIGYKYSTKAAMTVSIDDMVVPASKPQHIKDAEASIEEITKNFRRGQITEEERYKEVISAWNDADKKIEEDLLKGLDKYNNIYMMADSGARGSNKQIKQLAGMRGLMADTTGHTIELPIKSNFREGLDVLEYFISAHGARKGLSDTALRTADSGYLTRRLVDVSHDLIVHEDDCCAGEKEIPYMEIKAFIDAGETIESLEERITGRTIAETIVDKDTKEVIAEANTLVTKPIAKKIIAALEKEGRDSVKIRTVLTCKAKHGICSKCYGASLATGGPIGIGESVGIMAAQSIGEPGTQLTMRTFHTGGVAGGDITQGLPRVEELFEARKPKGRAIVTSNSGTVSNGTNPKKREVIVSGKDEKGNDVQKSYLIPYGSRIKVKTGDQVVAGDALTEGSIDPHDILEIKGIRAVQDYLLREVQRVYRLQGVDINDKHIEMIVRQMLRKVIITDGGDSELLEGMSIEMGQFNEINRKLKEEGKKLAKGNQVLLGITKASLETDSFLSAASFQETTKVLTDASIKGKIDYLVGHKENVIIGKLIPSGTGMEDLSKFKLTTEDDEIEDTEVQESWEFGMEEGDDSTTYDEMNEDDMEGIKEDIEDDYDDDDGSDE